MPDFGLSVVYLWLLEAGVTSAVVATIGAYVIVYGGMIAASIAYSSSQARKMRKALSSAAGSVGKIDQGRSLMVRDPVAPRQIVYGTVVKSGSISFFEVSGSANEYLHLHIDIADHLCQALNTVYFDKEAVPLDGSGNATGKYAGYARVKKFLGLVAGERDTTEEGELPGIWTSTDLGKEVCRLHVVLKNNPDLFVNGYPLIEVEVQGMKCYDWRTATTFWTANAGMVIGNFLMHSRFGKRIAQARIISADVIDASNISDESIVTDVGTEARYEINGVVNTDTEPDATLTELEAACAGCVCDPGGKWSIQVGAWRTPTVTLTDSDCADTTEADINPRASVQDTFNRVRGQFISPINQWVPADFPIVKNDTYMGWDNGIPLFKDVVYNFITSPSQAQRVAKIDLERGRQQIVVVEDFKFKGVQLKPGAVFMRTSDALGWAAKYFEVLEWTLKLVEINGGFALVVNLVYKETAAACFDWANGEETATDLADNTNIWDSQTVEAPSTVTPSTSNFLQNDGTVTPRLKLTIAAAVDSHILQGGRVETEYKQHADSDWIPWARDRGNVTVVYVTDVKSGVSYDARGRFVNILGVPGAWTTTTNYTISNDTTAPATPTGLAIAAIPSAINLDWDDNTEGDFDIYEVYRDTSGGFGSQALVFSGKVSNWTDPLVSGGTTYYYRIRALDTSGNASGYTSGVSTAPGSGSAGAELLPPLLTAADTGNPGDEPANRYSIVVDKESGEPAAELWMSNSNTGAWSHVVGATSFPYDFFVLSSKLNVEHAFQFRLAGYTSSAPISGTWNSIP